MRYVLPRKIGICRLFNGVEGNVLEVVDEVVQLRSDLLLFVDAAS
jgi:hypothetical protein